MSTARFVLLLVAAFVAMEPVTAATHRFVMHGIGARLHRSHHRATRPRGFETNDWYPVVFAGVVMLGLWAGFNVDGLAALVPVGIGITLYGATYALVHDGYIHGRVAWFGDRRVDVLDRLAEAHRVHHLYGRAPFGMLAPIVPSDLRQRAATTDRNPLSSGGAATIGR